MARGPAGTLLVSHNVQQCGHEHVEATAVLFGGSRASSTCSASACSSLCMSRSSLSDADDPSTLLEEGSTSPGVQRGKGVASPNLPARPNRSTPSDLADLHLPPLDNAERRSRSPLPAGLPRSLGRLGAPRRRHRSRRGQGGPRSRRPSRDPPQPVGKLVGRLPDRERWLGELVHTRANRAPRLQDRCKFRP